MAEETTSNTTMKNLTARNRGAHLTPSSNDTSRSPSSTSPKSPYGTVPLLFANSHSSSSLDNGVFDKIYIDDDDNNRYEKFSRQQRCKTWNQMVHKWKLLKPHSKIATAAIVVFILQHIFIGVWDQCFHQIGILGTSSSNKSGESSFAVVINTYKRPDMLRQAIQHYADTCGKRYGVGQVFVVWAEQNVQVPEPESFFNDHDNMRQGITKTAANNRATVQVLQVSKDSLNSRFEPIPQLDTTSVFMVDDDIRVACPSLALGFKAWQQTPDSMVGYYPRLSAPPIRPQQGKDDSVHQQLVYHAWPVVHLRQKLNFVLTKASFLHSKYLELYTNDETFPREIKDYVDEHMNCEDIAMSMLVANYTKYHASLEKSNSNTAALPARPIYVEGHVSDKGLFGGISTGTGHMATRSDCLTLLTVMLQSKGWGYPFEQQFDLGKSSFVRHAPGFWWQIRPSNFFEWFAFANVFL
jgi:hypothetical protein